MAQATKFGLSAIGLEALQGPVQMIVSYPIVHYLGILEFRLTQGRWLTSEEIDSMAAQNLIMMAGLALGMGIVQRYLPSEVKTSMLATFLKKYGMQFETLEAARQKLLADLADLADQGRSNDTTAVDALKKRAQVIEDEYKKFVGEVEADKAIDLKAIRAELKKVGAADLEGSAKLLSKELGLQEDVDLQRAGGDRQFTYKWGKTNKLEERLSDLGAQVAKEADPQTGLRTLTARFQGGDPLTFQERSTPYPGIKEVNVDPSDPVVQKLMADFKISDPAAQRFLLRMLTIELAINPGHGLASAAKPVHRKLNNMQAQGKDSVENQLLDLRQKGEVGSKAPPALIAKAEKLIDVGILSSQEWLSDRTHENMEGTVGEMLAYLETLVLRSSLVRIKR